MQVASAESNAFMPNHVHVHVHVVGTAFHDVWVAPYARTISISAMRWTLFFVAALTTSISAFSIGPPRAVAPQRTPSPQMGLVSIVNTGLYVAMGGVYVAMGGLGCAGWGSLVGGRLGVVRW